MKTRKQKYGFKIDDHVRVKRADGSLQDELYFIEWIGERGYCVIREVGKPLAGGQDSDVSLLQKVERR